MEVKSEIIDAKALKLEVLEGTELSEKKVENSLNYELLSDEERNKVDELIIKMDTSNTNAIIQYAANVQEKMASFSDSVVDSVRTKKAGEVGEVLASLVSEINDFDAVASKNDGGILTKLESLFHRGKNQVEKIVAKYSTVESNVDKIANTLEKNKITMLKDIAVFENMFNENVKFFKEISLYIIAAEKKLEFLKNEELPKLKKTAEETQEEMDVQKANDLSDIITKLEKKVHDLKISRVISIQMAPQIRMLQSNESELVDKVQSAIVNTIPLWKSQLLLALGVANARTAYKVQDDLANATNELLQKNSELLKQGSIDIAKASERSIVDIETLRITNRNIVETIEEVIRIHNDGAKNREIAEQEILQVENELKDQLNKVRVIE